MGLESLFEPLQLGSATVANRIVLPAHSPRLSGKRYYRYFEERLSAGIGMVVTSRYIAQTVSSFTPGPSGLIVNGDVDDVLPDPSTPEGMAYFDEKVLPELTAEAELAHRYGAKCVGQLLHVGSYAIYPNMQMSMSPSGIPDELLGENGHELEIEEIGRLVRTIVLAAQRAKRAGMDGVELHAAHGLLLNEFISPATNKRTDQYGGSVENRCRILTEALEGIRGEVGPDFIVGLRMPGAERGDEGMSAAEGVRVVQTVKPHIDYLSVSGGSESARQRGLVIPSVMSGIEYDQAVFADDAARIREATGVPVVLSGRITDPMTAAELIENGTTDMVGVLRAMIADPAWTDKVRRGDLADIRRCAGDNNGCRARTLVRTRGGALSIGCTVNPAAGQEEALTIRKAETSKRVVVVGAGPAGMEAARVATLRGHHVTLLERDAEVGGQVLIAALDPRGVELRHAVSYLEEQMRRLQVDLRLGVEADLETVAAESPDVVIVANGARHVVPDLAADADGSVPIMTLDTVLREEREPGARVVVVAGQDGYRAPLSMAETLAQGGRSVHLVTERALVGESLDPGTAHGMTSRLLGAGVELSTFTAFEGVADGQVITRHCLTPAAAVSANLEGIRFLDDIDTVIVVQRRSRSELARTLRAGLAGIPVQAVGDALAARRILTAVKEGALAAHGIE